MEYPVLRQPTPRGARPDLRSDPVPDPRWPSGDSGRGRPGGLLVATELIIPSRQWEENQGYVGAAQGGVAISQGSVGQDARLSVYAGSELHVGRDLHLNLCVSACGQRSRKHHYRRDIYIRSEPIRVFAYWGIRGIGRSEGRLVAAGDVHFSGSLSFRDADGEFAFAMPLEVRSGRDIVIDAPGRFANSSGRSRPGAAISSPGRAVSF